MSLSRISGLISQMPKQQQKSKLYDAIKRYGRTKLFDYALHPDAKTKELPVWSKLLRNELKVIRIAKPSNDFEEMITLTEEGKLWHYPIDNEQGIVKEKQVPFEDHIFFDDQLEKFSENEQIQSFMQYVTMGLGNNPWMTVERKREIIDWYLEYFEGKKDLYKQAGFEI